MKTKARLTKLLTGILAVVVILAGGWWLWSSCKTEKAEQPYHIWLNNRAFSYGEWTFIVGSLEPIKEGYYGHPVPRIEGEDIYSFSIKSDTFGTFAKMQPGKGDIELGDFEDKLFFFTGYIKPCDIHHLIEENPDIEWLRHLSSLSISCFEIEQMIPVEDNDSVLSLEAPEELPEEFEILVTVKNILPLELVETTLSIAIRDGPFRIVAIEPADLKITSGSNYSTIIVGEYAAGEEKNYKFQIQSRGFGEIPKKDFEISASFAGYGTEEKEIMPLYSKKVQKYRLLWLKD